MTVPLQPPPPLLHSAWISANAGSGKTTALVRRVLRLLVLGATPERICCLTYTKAAAGEMHERIARALRELLLLEDTACHEKLTEILERPPSPTEIIRARNLFALVLDSPSGGVQLTTIHGFCQQLLTRFPIEAGISPHFTVLEDAEADLLKMEAQRRLLDLHGKEGPLRNALSKIITASSEMRFHELLQAITNHQRAWEQVWAGHSPEHLRATYAELFDLPTDATEANLQATALRTLIPPEAATILQGSLETFLNHTTQTDQSLGKIFAAWLEADGGPTLDLLDALMNTMLTQGDRTPKAKAITTGWKNTPTGECLERIQASCADIAEKISRAACMEESFSMALMARSYQEIYAQCKQQRHALDYDDIIRLTRQLLSLHTGWVMTQLDHRIDHLMIDEAQDTSADQWEIVRLLVEELIAYADGIGSGNIPRSLLVVGDEKQSIFSFQGAAPERFADAKNDFSALLAHAPAPLVAEALLTSYRSAAPILSFVDAVANLEAIRPCLSASGAQQHHKLHHTTRAGQVMLHPLISPPETEVSPPFTIPTEYAITLRAEHRLAETVAQQLHQWITEGIEISGEKHPVKAGDILILVRKRGRLMQSLIGALESMHVPVAGLDRLQLNAHLAIRDLLATMAWCSYPHDDLSLAHLLASPIIGLNDAALRALCVGRTTSLWGRILQDPSQADLSATLEDILAHAHTPPYHFLTHLLESMGARQRFAARFGQEVNEVLDELKAQATAMPAHLPSTLRAFHRWISRSTREVKREQGVAEANLVRLMTVHGSKGLEAPIVLIVDSTSTPNTQKDIIFPYHSPSGYPVLLVGLSETSKRAAPLRAAKESRKTKIYHEYARLFYVASTRPKQVLHIFGIRPQQPWRMKGSWYELAQTALGSMQEVRSKSLNESEDAPQHWILETPPSPDKDEKSSHHPSHSKNNARKPPTWLRSPMLPPLIPLPLLSPSRLVEAAPMPTLPREGGPTSSQQGITIHRVLQSLTAESNAKEIAALLAAIATEWDPATREKIAAQILSLHQKEAWLWAYPSYAEVGICGTIVHEGRLHPIVGQIDRLVDTPEGWVIVDYKTGGVIPETAEDIPPSHRAQMEAYRSLLTQQTPKKPVYCALLYTTTTHLLWLETSPPNIHPIAG